MNDHNLDDLIIDTIAPKNNKTKSLLTTVALLIVVLIVTIILTKTLLKSPDDTPLTFEENLSEMIAPELKLQEPSKAPVEVAKPKEEPVLSTIIEETITRKTITEKAISKPIAIGTIKAPVNAPVETIKTIEETIEETITPSAKVIAQPIKEKPVKKTIPNVTTKPKVVTKKPVKVPVVKKPVKTSTTTVGNYYVQVGSFKENPSPRFLSVIKSSGFKYVVSKPDRVGNKKLLIGPYKTRKEVDKAREIVRDRIHKSAFVVQK